MTLEYYQHLLANLPQAAPLTPLFQQLITDITSLKEAYRLQQRTTDTPNTSTGEQWLVAASTIRDVAISLRSVKESLEAGPAEPNLQYFRRAVNPSPWWFRILAELAEAQSLISQILRTKPYAGLETVSSPLPMSHFQSEEAAWRGFQDKPIKH